MTNFAVRVAAVVAFVVLAAAWIAVGVALGTFVARLIG